MTLQVDEHWQAPPASSSHQVTYRVDADSGCRQADIDGMVFSLADPCLLQPVAIKKPWGQEIWYTGIEARGESRILPQPEADTALPLGTYLALAPEYLTSGQTPLLLKILDPLPTPVLGELYLEVHETKQEAYVVTGIDPSAWPDGKGRIRFGINQQHRQTFSDDQAFRAAFLDAHLR